MQQTMLEATPLPLPVNVASLPLPNATVESLRSAFQELDEEHRIVLSLHFLEELSLADVALVLDDSEHNVREVFVEAITLLSTRESRRRDAA